jgi:hypothetical protein
VVEDQVADPEGAETVAEHGERDVPQERHPVLVERDEPDDDEEVEVRLDAARGEHHEADRAEDEAAGHGERREPARPQHVAEQEEDHGPDQRVPDDQW